jgi:hypothetical protein
LAFLPGWPWSVRWLATVVSLCRRLAGGPTDKVEIQDVIISGVVISNLTSILSTGVLYK